MAEPSNSVPAQLLRHVHLVSSHPYPKLPQVNLDIAVEYLIQAPRIVRELAPVSWMYLDCPPDGEVMLVWQPSQLRTQAASDGFIWADAEMAFSSEMKGYTVEMYIHRSGYRPNYEPLATHCRRRFRLTPSQNPDPSLPPPDQSLWLWHYSQTELQFRFPAHQIRMSDPVRQSLHERSILQKHGQLVRKEFMLRDNANWPTINLPGTPNPSYPQQVSGYPGDVISHMNRSQQQVYIQQQQGNATQHVVGPSPAKRPRHGGPVHVPGSTTAIPIPVVAQDTTYDEEEGTSGGDYMDFLTPRDISLHRYTQHHEWLEEILNSPYDTSQIIPGQLGLGRKGELESLTRDFFDAPIGATPKETFSKVKGDSPVEDSATPRVGRLEAGKAQDFTKRADERIAEINAEMEKLKRQHTRRMAKLNRGRAFKEAEQNFRVFTLEMVNGEVTKYDALVQRLRADELARGLEAQLGKSIKVIKDVECIDKGGLEEKSQSQLKDLRDQDYEMVDTYGNFDGATDTATTYPESRSPVLATSTESADNASSEVHDHARVAEITDQGKVNIDEVQNTSEPKDATAEDWVMVDKEKNPTVKGKEVPETEGLGENVAMSTSPGQPNPTDSATGDSVPIFEQGIGDVATEDFDANDFGDGIDFGDLDTGREDLSGYTPGMETAGLNDRGDLTNEGAFEESFPMMEEGAGHEDKTPGV